MERRYGKYIYKSMTSGEVIIQRFDCEIIGETAQSYRIRIQNWYGDIMHNNPVKWVRKQNVVIK